jgi:hypothetical protein
MALGTFLVFCGLFRRDGSWQTKRKQECVAHVPTTRVSLQHKSDEQSRVGVTHHCRPSAVSPDTAIMCVYLTTLPLHRVEW